MKGEVLLSPLLLPEFELKGKIVVVVDILRATSTICTALGNGASSVIPVSTVDEAKDYHDKGYLSCGERNGVKVPDLDLGNSPMEYHRDIVEDREVVLTTTNGTRCIHMSEGAEEILIGSFLNLSAISEYLSLAKKDFVIFCAGWKNRVNMEDSLFAGAIIHKMRKQLTDDNDSAQMVEALYEQSKTDLEASLQNASHVVRFRRLGVEGDVEYCMQTDLIPVLPVFEDGHIRIRQ